MFKMDNEGNGQEIQLRNLAANKPLSLCNWKNSMVSYDEHLSLLTYVDELLAQFFWDYCTPCARFFLVTTKRIVFLGWVIMPLRDITVVLMQGGWYLVVWQFHTSVLSFDLRGLLVFRTLFLARHCDGWLTLPVLCAALPLLFPVAHCEVDTFSLRLIGHQPYPSLICHVTCVHTLVREATNQRTNRACGRLSHIDVTATLYPPFLRARRTVSRSVFASGVRLHYCFHKGVGHCHRPQTR